MACPREKFTRRRASAGCNPGETKGAARVRRRPETPRTGGAGAPPPHQRDACGNRAPGGGSGRVDGTLLRTFAT